VPRHGGQLCTGEGLASDGGAEDGRPCADFPVDCVCARALGHHPPGRPLCRQLDEAFPKVHGRRRGCALAGSRRRPKHNVECSCGLALEPSYRLPSLVGLAFIPLMPFIDEPVEHLIDKGFDKAWPKADAPPKGEKKKH